MVEDLVLGFSLVVDQQGVFDGDVEVAFLLRCRLGLGFCCIVCCCLLFLGCFGGLLGDGFAGCFLGGHVECGGMCVCMCTYVSKCRILLYSMHR